MIFIQITPKILPKTQGPCIIDLLHLQIETVARYVSGSTESKKGGLTVNNKALFLFVSTALLPVLGCGGGKPDQITIAKPESIPPSGLMTLSQQQLLALDWHSRHRMGARVELKRIVDPGVEFDISFPGNNPGYTTLEFTSTGKGGRGTLVGGDISGFKAFALKVTLVSINASSQPDIKHKLVVGALIGPTTSGLSTYMPVTLGMTDADKTVIAKTLMRIDNIRTIGFHLHMLNPQDWPGSESEVTIRIEPAENAANAPWITQ